MYAHITYGDLSEEMNLVHADKCIVFVECLLQLLGVSCRTASCSAALEDVQVIDCGYGMKLEWKCVVGHIEKWYSSPFYGSGFGTNYLVNTAVLVSGGSIQQFHRFCNFLTLRHESQDSFYR